MRRILVLTALVIITLVSSPVSAKEGATYIYSGVDKTTAKRTFQDLTGEPVSDMELFALPNVELPILDDIWFVGAPQATACDPSVRDEFNQIADGDIEQLADLAERFLVDLDQDRSAGYLELLLGAIPCSESMIDRSQIARIFFLMGVNTVYKMESEDVSKAYFRQAVVLGGRPEWDKNYPAMVQSVYERASSEAEAFGRVSIDYHLKGLDLTLLVLDGENLSLDDDVAGSMRVLPGMHVVQWRRGQGEIKTRVVEVSKYAHLVSTEGLQSILAMRPEVGEDDSSIGFVQETFLARQVGKVSILIVEETDDTDDNFSYSYHRVRESDDLEPISYLMGKKKDLTIRQREAVYKPLGFRVGGGYVFEQFFAANVDVNFWLYRGFGLQFGGDVGFLTYLGLTPDDNRVWVMPSVRGGARLEFRRDRPVKPYVSLLGRVSFKGDPTKDAEEDFQKPSKTSAGPMVGGGVTFMVASESQKTQIFGVALEVGGGPMFSPDETSFALWATINIVFREFELRD